MFRLPVYFISDNHFALNIDNYERERRAKLYQVFEKIKISGGSLVIGGDFFDFWFNYRYVVPAGYVDLLEQLDQLNQAGILIHFVLGNHDYWDFGYFKEKFNAAVYKKNLDFNIDGKKIQVCHGDGLLQNDGKYRFMKQIIRSNLCIVLFKYFHPDLGCWLAKKISNTSAAYHHHNLKHQTIRAELLEYAKFQWQLGINTVLLGHYHQTGIIEENGNYLIFMGDWLQHYTITRLDKNGWWQGDWQGI